MCFDVLFVYECFYVVKYFLVIEFVDELVFFDDWKYWEVVFQKDFCDVEEIYVGIDCVFD